VADDARPHLVCLGKALGGGMPVSACLGRADVMAAWGAPTSEALHTGTFFGNPLGCAAALAALDAIEREGLCERAEQSGAWLLETLRVRLGSRVRAVRGAGMLVGVEVESGAHGLRLVRALLERGYIVLPAAADARVVSLTPPLTIETQLLSGFVDAFDRALSEVAR
jgi:4-aminobutyrate aminotransferase/(S)-3-amino-2-methylpropionate transaminase